MILGAPSVYIRDTGTAKGRGAFARRGFAVGDTVDVCPVVLFHGKTSTLPPEIRRLLFNWSVLAVSAETRGATHGLVLGFGSLYNHDNPSSMRYEADTEHCAMHFIAVRDILADEELTINYNARGGGHESADDSWFAGMGVSPWRPDSPP